eukprot:TRINITY_DN22754_c0_g1_i1.p1 TRINITY_DN22754_c0_g1~~TRINITY_DN22754_c0_g1_i1.p1  ORF type:complete len:287 (+),score=56.33 TRINITY_DN22754_c0_g1_i1:28-888(+)
MRLQWQEALRNVCCVTRRSQSYRFCFFNDAATTEIYTLHIVGSVRCVQETVSTQSTWVSAGVGDVNAVMLGVITGVTGGIIRDVLVGEVPMVFQKEIYLYATAAFCGAAFFVLLEHWRPGGESNRLAATAVTLLLRLAAIRWKLTLPLYREQRPPPQNQGPGLARARLGLLGWGRMTKHIQTLGIIAGSRSLPLELARNARAAGIHRLVAVAFEGETDPALAELVDSIVWVRVGQLSKMIGAFKSQGARHCVMAGQIAPRNLFDVRPDLRAVGKKKKKKKKKSTLR